MRARKKRRLTAAEKRALASAGLTVVRRAEEPLIKEGE
jgi:hypothetical protein